MMAADKPVQIPEGDSIEGETRQPIYEGSTQFRHWRYSKEQLASTRASLNEAAVAAIRNAFEADLAGSFSRIPRSY